MKLRPALILVLLINIIFGCTRFVKSDISVFHVLPENKEMVTYVFFPFEYQKSNLEYKTYQDLIRQELAKHNYVEISQAQIPDIIIAFSYGIDSGKEKLFHTYGTLENYGTYWGTTNYKSSTYSITEYTSGLWLFMVDRKSIGKEKLNLLYEGTVISFGSSFQLPKIMPKMIKALFKEFPGKSGSTRRELLPMQ